MVCLVLSNEQHDDIRMINPTSLQRRAINDWCVPKVAQPMKQR